MFKTVALSNQMNSSARQMVTIRAQSQS